MSVPLRAPWALGGLAVALALIAAIIGTVMALLGAELTCVGGGGGTAAPAPSSSAVSEIPAARLRIYRQAGQRFDIDWAFLASIGTQECGAGACPGVNPSGCAGPMEIAYVRESPCSPGPGPTIWERFRVDADGGGADIFDPADAVFTAAHILRADLGAPPTGGSYTAYREAACNYYGACADAAANYADEVMARALRYGFGREGSPEGAVERRAPVAAGSSCEGSPTGGASGSAIVRIARAQLGTAESPPGSNCTKYGPCEEWCSLFLAWVWEHAGIKMRGGTAPYAYSGSIYEWVKAHGGRVLAPSVAPAPGDAVLFGWGPTASEHVAIVEAVFAGGEIATIDGNFGDQVARVGPFPPMLAVVDGEPAPIYAYAEPPGVGANEGASAGG